MHRFLCSQPRSSFTSKFFLLENLGALNKKTSFVLIFSVFALWLTIKFKQSLNDFEPVPTEPTAPQLAHNPAYAQPPLKSYPNMA